MTAPVWTVTKRRECVQPIPGIVLLREKGCPLLTVETEANGDLWSTNEGGSSMVGSLGCSSQLNKNIFFPHRTLFHFKWPHCPASWTGSRAGSPVSYLYGLTFESASYCMLVLCVTTCYWSI